MAEWSCVNEKKRFVLFSRSGGLSSSAASVPVPYSDSSAVSSEEEQEYTGWSGYWWYEGEQYWVEDNGGSPWDAYWWIRGWWWHRGEWWRASETMSESGNASWKRHRSTAVVNRRLEDELCGQAKQRMRIE